MPKFFNIEMLPAKHGDALLIEYGDEDTHRMLIDGGPLNAYPDLASRLAKLPQKGIELLVITHVDNDHVEGIVRLLAEPLQKWAVKPREIWFNGWRHIQEAKTKKKAGTLGGREGEFLSALIHHRAAHLWNKSFEGNAVGYSDRPEKIKVLAGGMAITLLSPDAAALAALEPDWRTSATKWKMPPGDLEKALKKLVQEPKFHPTAGMTLGPEDLTKELLDALKGRDSSKANASSIAFIAEYGGMSCMFLGDAHMRVVCKSLMALGYSKTNPLKVGAVKVSHHGSKNNITKEFFELVDSEHYLISSNGDVHEHPDREAIEAIIEGSRHRPPTLWFNYRSNFTEHWEAKSNETNASYKTRFPDRGADGMVVQLQGEA